MKKITKKQARDFLQRWRAVEKLEKAQLRTSSFAQKYRQLITLLSAQDLFSLSKREKETQRASAQQNWEKLRTRLAG